MNLDKISLSRRDVLRWSVALPAAAVASRIVGQEEIAQAQAMAGPHKLPPLPYAYSALNPTIDTMTMRLHHDKHHKKYVDELNKAVASAPSLRGMTPQHMLMQLNDVPVAVREKVRNNGGGHVNHSMFWSIMSPRGGGRPTGEIARVITSGFGTFEAFKNAFNSAGEKRFGSGWVWLVADNGRMKIISTPNQDNPLLMGMFPVMGNDVWEHAYYLKYKNRRADYLKAWWNVVDWDAINGRLRYMKANWK